MDNLIEKYKKEMMLMAMAGNKYYARELEILYGIEIDVTVEETGYEDWKSMITTFNEKMK